jgi:hypothetical protein
VLWTDNGATGYQFSTSSSPKGPFTKSTKRAELDSVHGRLKPADFAIAEVGKLKALNHNDQQSDLKL